MNENYAHPAMPEGAEEGILKGMYLLARGRRATAPRVQLLGSGTILREVIAGGRAAARATAASSADVWSVTRFTELARDGQRGRALEPAAPDGRRRGRRTSSECLGGHDGPGRSPSTDYMRAFADADPRVRAAPLHGARHRRLRPQRLPREAAALLRGRPPLRRGRRAAGARRRGRGRARRRSAEAIKKYGIDPDDAGALDGLRSRRWHDCRKTSYGPRHRRLQRRPGHRGAGEAGRHGRRGRLARHARVRQGDDGRARRRRRASSRS